VGRHRRLTEEIVRYVMAGIRVSPEVAEYPDRKKITAQARTDRRPANGCGSFTTSSPISGQQTVDTFATVLTA